MTLAALVRLQRVDSRQNVRANALELTLTPSQIARRVLGNWEVDVWQGCRPGSRTNSCKDQSVGKVIERASQALEGVATDDRYRLRYWLHVVHNVLQWLRRGIALSGNAKRHRFCELLKLGAKARK